MFPSVVHCGSTVYGFGDNTAGPIWSYKVSPKSPLRGYEYKTNYPIGENLYAPINWTSSAQSTIEWSLQKMAGPICGTNLFDILGFLSTAMVTFGFILWLFKKKSLAVLGGYVVAFSPYEQMKIGGHPAYGFISIFVAIIWSALYLIKKPTLLRSLLLALSLGFCIYFDPYFTLYGSLAFGSVILSWIIIESYRYYKKRRMSQLIVKQFKYLLITIGLLFVILSPYLYEIFSNYNNVNSQAASNRGNVLMEAQACSNYPWEYALPFVLNPIPRLLGFQSKYVHMENKLKNNFSCGVGEDTVGLSLTMLFIVAVSMVVLFWEKINKRLSFSSKKINHLNLALVAFVSLFCLGIIFGLPPNKYFGIPTPTRILLDLTPTWRTLARSYILVNLGLVLMTVYLINYYVELKILSSKFNRIIFFVIFLFIFIEYQSFTPLKGNQLSTFSYKNDIPAVYTYIIQQKNIHSIAEYPLEAYNESDAESYYQSMQFVHNIPMLNANSSLSSQENIRSSIKNLADPQTLPALRALGVDAVVVHGITDLQYNSFPKENISIKFAAPQFTLAAHTPTVKTDSSAIIFLYKYNMKNAPVIGILSSGFFRNTGLIVDSYNWAYEAVNGANLKIYNIIDKRIAQTKTEKYYCFDIRTSAPGQTADFRPLVDGVEVDGGQIDNTYRKIVLSTTENIVLKNNHKENMQITSLGCSD